MGQEGVTAGQGRLRQLKHRTKKKCNFFEEVEIFGFHLIVFVNINNIV